MDKHIEQRIIHIYINDLCAAFHLMPGNGKRLIKFLVFNQP